MRPCLRHSVNEVTTGDRRGRARQAIFVGMGVHPGFADLTVLLQGRALFLEIQSKIGRLGSAQETFPNTLQAQGFAWALVRSVEEASADLRHSFAFLLVSGGTSLEMIAKLLGHSQLKTTQRYAHPMDSRLRRIMRSSGTLPVRGSLRVPIG